MKSNRLKMLAQQEWIGEAIHAWGHCSDDDVVKPLDLSVIEKLFKACDSNDPEYDREFHEELYRQKPHFFGPDGLEKP